MKTINWNVRKSDCLIITKIVKRAEVLAKKHNRPFEIMRCDMDVTACHANGHPLDLELLLNAPDFDFAHDVFGIERHIDRETGELKDFFSPRFSRR